MTAVAELSPARQLIGRSVTTLLGTHPFYAMVLLQLELIEDPSCDTAWTDGKSIGYNPKFVEQLSTDERLGVLCHEVMHVALGHPWRQGSREIEKWNIATDAAINGIIEDDNMKLPPGCVAPIRDKYAEEIYLTVPEQKPRSGGGGKGKGGQQPPGTGSTANPDPGGCGGVRQPTTATGQPVSKAEMEKQAADAKFMVQQAAAQAAAAGKLPANMARTIQEVLEPRVPWREILCQFIDTQAKRDYSFRRPNMRFRQSGVMLPSLYSEEFGRGAMSCDTSGSITPDILKEVAGAGVELLRLYEEQGIPPELTMIWFDVDYYPQVITDADQLDPKGGGGTSYVKMFKYVRTKLENMKYVIVVTDGECGDFGDEPGIPVLWILTKANRRFSPPFGEVAWIIDN